MKKITTAVVAFALALTVVAPVAASAQTSASYTFNTNLTVGARGADVVALQSFLESKGVLTIPAGVAKGYFGAMTRSALAAYQSMKGIKPAAGYFGPITRAAVSAEGTTSTTTPTTPNPVTPITNSGVEGSVDVRLAATPASNADIQTQTDVPVLGIEFRGKIADVAVQTVDLKVAVTNVSDSSAENPGTLINTIKVWDGSNVLATIPVSLSSFTKDSNNNYYLRVSGINFVVPKDTTKVLTFSFSTNGMDSNRTVVVGGYNTTSVRTVSGNGVNSFYDASSLSLSHTFKKPGNSSLTLSAATSPLRSTNNKIQASSGAKGVSTVVFNVKAETGDAKITSVHASTTADGTKPTTLYL